MKEFIINNIWWFFLGSYFIGALIYYKMAFEAGRQKSFSEIGFQEIFEDIIYFIFWLPTVAFILVKLLLTIVFFIPIKVYGKITEKKKE